MSKLIKSCTFDDGVVLGILETPMWPNRFYVGRITKQRDEWLPLEATTVYHRELHQAFSAFRNDVLSHVMAVPAAPSEPAKVRCGNCWCLVDSVQEFGVLGRGSLNLCKICASMFPADWMNTGTERHVIGVSISKAVHHVLDEARKMVKEAVEKAVEK